MLVRNTTTKMSLRSKRVRYAITVGSNVSCIRPKSVAFSEIFYVYVVHKAKNFAKLIITDYIIC